MKALILRGKYKGTVCEVSQWCNDWFTLDPRNNRELKGFQRIEIMRKPFSPAALAFTWEDFNTIKTHKDNGILFGIFEERKYDGKFGAYEVGFKKRK